MCGSLLAQLAAYCWWDVDWGDRRRLERLGVAASIPEECVARCCLFFCFFVVMILLMRVQTLRRLS